MEARSFARTIGRGAVAVSTALVIVALAVLPFLTPTWVAFEQGRTDAAGWTGYGEADLRGATNAILADLVLGPPDFDVEVGGQPVLTDRERAHMRDVRGVFAGFYVAAAAGLVVLIVAWRSVAHDARWRAVRAGAVGLGVAVVAAGVIAVVAFDLGFELFHRLFFSAGSWTFDPGRDRLVQLFPAAFWFETTIAVGAVILGVALVTAVLAGRRLHAQGEAGEPVSVPPGASTTIEPGAAR